MAVEAPGAGESYEIVAPIGRGGMGEVWRAVQRSLGREVAIKQLVTDNPAAVDHFISEARVTARLSHANVIPVHALGRGGDGRPMIAMKLVKGTCWQDLLHGPGATRDRQAFRPEPRARDKAASAPFAAARFRRRPRPA